MTTTNLEDATHSLWSAGRVALTGRKSDPVLRWLQGQRRLIKVWGGFIGVGLLATIAGVVLRDVGGWALGILVGAFLVLVGLIGVGVGLMVKAMMKVRLSAEDHPVVIDATGITLRGIGPVPWSDLAPPERRHIPVKNDIGGWCTVMPLTAQGHARVNSQPGSPTLLVGPKPYLRFDVPYLLLPGIDGLTEDETMELFRVAHEHHLR